MAKLSSPVRTHDPNISFDNDRVREEETSKGESDKGRPSHVHFEVAIHAMCLTPLNTLRERWDTFLKSNLDILKQEGEVNLENAPDDLKRSCRRATVLWDGQVHSDKLDLHIHAFKLSEEEPTTEELEPVGGDDEWTAACDNLTLPHSSLDGMWDSLILAPGTKRHLLAYAQSALLFSDKKVSSHIVTWNRLLLLYGPPGTGKTSLCRALAHKLAIRMSDRFSSATLLEIHSHSLFSKWFSTSGKLIHRLFELVREMVQDDPNTLVCVLVDEVESLAASRTDLGGAGEPSDAMRAVNALLTSLDRLRCFPNVLVLTTTNLASSVDVAFVDRADVKQFIGLPILEARYEILRSCLEELVRVGIIDNDEADIGLLYHIQDMDATVLSEEQRAQRSLQLLRCAAAADGLSGRTLRRLPLQSHARCGLSTEPTSMDHFLYALDKGIAAEQASRRDLDSTEA